jgi:hypothetical protein
MSNLKPAFFDLFRYTSLTDRRDAQLDEEKNIDGRLYTCYTHCPCDTFEYVMKTREMNRMLSKKVHNASILDTPSTYEKSLSVQDDVLDVPQDHAESMCNRLRHLNAFMNRCLKEKPQE